MAVVALSLLALALLVALLLVIWTTSRERKELLDKHAVERRELLDRIQFPAVAQAHAIETALAPSRPEEPQDIYDEEVPLEGDLRLDDLLRSS